MRDLAMILVKELLLHCIAVKMRKNLCWCQWLRLAHTLLATRQSPKQPLAPLQRSTEFVVVVIVA